MCIFPSAEWNENQVASSNNANIGLSEDKMVKIEAGASLKTIKKSKYKKVKAAIKIKKVKVKVKYFYKGKWRYKWVYKTYSAPVTKTQTVSAASTSSVGAYNVVITSEYVYATGRCSCSLYTDYGYHTMVFYNYNPSTNRWGVLNFEQGPAPKTSPEGMWYDTITDMDFCLVHGKSHDNRNVFLKPYNGVINGYKVVNGYFTNEVVTPVTDNSNSNNSNSNTSGTGSSTGNSSGTDTSSNNNDTSTSNSTQV
ncbi:MAG TPA: hypothetical protein VK426_00570 [Methanobacterium sp.]|nr:hypothetical protein [Methanobacterium sp.]